MTVDGEKGPDPVAFAASAVSLADAIQATIDQQKVSTNPGGEFMAWYVPEFHDRVKALYLYGWHTWRIADRQLAAICGRKPPYNNVAAYRAVSGLRNTAALMQTIPPTSPIATPVPSPAVPLSERDESIARATAQMTALIAAVLQVRNAVELADAKADPALINPPTFDDPLEEARDLIRRAQGDLP